MKVITTGEDEQGEKCEQTIWGVGPETAMGLLADAMNGATNLAKVNTVEIHVDADE